ncbi:MAG: phage tail tape measure protein [Bacillaceae bacterium]|nr:phage tail tape measure protein [Bacillaceae bacterium]
MSKQYNVVTNLIAKTGDFVSGMKKASETSNNFTQNFNKKMTDVGKKMTSVGKSLTTFVSLPLLGLGAGFIKVASDAEEMRGKFSVVFDGMENEMRSWAEESSKAMGRSQIDIEGYLAETQNMLVGMGMVREEGADLSKQIVEMGIDLASFNNLAEGDALRNLQSAISGNHSASQSLGAVLNENTLAMAMNEMGINKNWKELTEAEKMQVRYHAIMMQSTDALGDAERTSGSFANQMRRFKGQVKDVSADFGELLLPMATKVVEKVNELVGWFGNLNGSTQKVILIIGALAAVIPPIILAFGMIATAIGTIGAPVAIVVAAIAGFIAILASAYSTSDTFRDRVNGAIQQVRDFVSNAIQFVRNFWDENGQAILDSAREKFEQVQQVVLSVMDSVTSFISEKLSYILDFWNENGSQIMQATQNIFSFIQSVISFVMPFIEMLIIQIWNNIKGVINGALNIIMGFIKVFSGLFTGDFSKMWEGIKQMFSGAVEFLWNLIQLGFIGRILKVIRTFGSSASNVISGMVSGITSFFSNLLSRGTSIFNSLRNAIMNPINSARSSVTSTVQGMINNAISRFTNLRSRATSIFNSVRNSLVNPINTARDRIKSAIDRITGFFSGLSSKLRIDIPRPKLPRFSLNGEFSLMPPRVPTIGLNWYKDGGIFSPNSPQVIGIGDHPNAPEAALPLTDSVLGTIGASIAKLMPQGNSMLNIDSLQTLFSPENLINSISTGVMNGLSNLVEQLELSIPNRNDNNQNTYEIHNTFNYHVNGNMDRKQMDQAAKYTFKQIKDSLRQMGVKPNV